MYYRPPKKPKLAVIFTRDDPLCPDPWGAKAREASCLQYCRQAGIPVSHTVRVCCDAVQSLALLRQLLGTLPGELDTLIAARLIDYSTQLLPLGRLCLMFQCRRIWVYALDSPGPLYKSIPGLKQEDFTLAEQRFAEAVK